MVTIQGKTLGSRKPLFTDFSVPLPPDVGGDGGLLLRDLIASVVRHEVDAFHQRQEDRQFIRALTEREIQAAAERGKVEMGDSETPIVEVDVDEAIANAWQAFEDGIYLVVVDDQEQRELDAQVFVREDSRLTFIRLMLLAGG